VALLRTWPGQSVDVRRLSRASAGRRSSALFREFLGLENRSNKQKQRFEGPKPITGRARLRAVDPEYVRSVRTSAVGSTMARRETGLAGKAEVRAE
jgi:hypothetical protein